MFRSFGRNGADNPVVEQEAILIDKSDETPLDAVQDDYRARHAQPESEVSDNREAEYAIEPSPDPAVIGAAEEWDEPEDFRFIVRPYTWTRGRTRPVQDLAVETLVSTSDKGRDLTSVCSAEHAAIAGLCVDIRSVAEVAALLGLPLGVARVLLADMVDTGLVHVHRNPTGWGTEFTLLERVLDGLYRL